MNATHNMFPDNDTEVEKKTIWCRVCKAFRTFFKCGRFYWCESCRYAEGTDAELTVMDE